MLALGLGLRRPVLRKHCSEEFHMWHAHDDSYQDFISNLFFSPVCVYNVHVLPCLSGGQRLTSGIGPYLPSTLFEASPLVLCCTHQATWPGSVQTSLSISHLAQGTQGPQMHTILQLAFTWALRNRTHPYPHKANPLLPELSSPH